MLVVGIGFLFGAFLGSFLNVCIHRLPRNESIVLPPSRCYACGTQVRWYDNLPIISYLVLRGRCRWCGTSYSVRYLVMEVLFGALAAVVLWRVTAPGSVWPAPWLISAGLDPIYAQALAGGAILLLVWVLVVAAMIDLEHMIVPDELTKGFQPIAPLVAALCGSNLALAGPDYSRLWTPREWLWQDVPLFGPQLQTMHFIECFASISIGALLLLAASLPAARYIYSSFCPESQRWSEADHRGFAIGVWWFIAALTPAIVTTIVLALTLPEVHQGVTVALAQAVLGSLAGWWSLYLIGLLATIAFRKNAMGYGDVKFLAPVGAFLGPFGVVYTFFLAAVIGTVVGVPLRLMKNAREIPFIPYLVAGALVTLFVGPELHRLLFGQWLGRG